MEIKERELIESYIDKYGLDIVLDSVAGICYGKGEHVRSNWQDIPLAKKWDKAGISITTCSGKIKKENIHL